MYFVLLKPRIDPEKCDGCGLCVDVCIRRCLVLINGMVALAEEVECDWCTQCEAVCANGAISCPYKIVHETTTFKGKTRV